MKELVQLKYIILKNLALINTKETKLNHEKALNFLIQVRRTCKWSANERGKDLTRFWLFKAAEIDSTDACLWYEIGENAFNLEKYLISRWAYEESLRLSPSNWPCLDKLVVLLFSLGHYSGGPRMSHARVVKLLLMTSSLSACLKHIFNALKMDKFYFNGLLLMKKIEAFKEIHYMHQIELFQRIN